jgi:transcriptional regulator with XRE-family HTH domain
MQGKNSGVDKFLGDRLRKWRKTLPLRAYELAKIIHISQGSLSDIENNKSLPSADTLTKLFLKTDLNIIWLLTARGPMIKSGMTEEEVMGGVVSEDSPIYGQDNNLKTMIDSLVRVYQRGDPEKRAHILGYLIGADPGE